MSSTAEPTGSTNGGPQPISGERGASILGPRNVAIETANPDLLVSPSTDAGTVPNLKRPFALSHNRMLSGRRVRETTIRELPVSRQIARGNMPRKPAGTRELHWHKETEWACVIAGSCRIGATGSARGPDLEVARALSRPGRSCMRSSRPGMRRVADPNPSQTGQQTQRSRRVCNQQGRT
jgi:oxalate decarboxylase